MDKKLNNRGFTLIELLSVFVILISVSFVAVGGILSSLNKREVDECYEQQEMAISAAKIYFSLEGVGDISVYISELKNGGYIDEESKSNLLNPNDQIIVTGSGYEYDGNSCE